MNESSKNLSDEALAKLWDSFGHDYEQLGYRRKSYELFAKYLDLLTNDIPKESLSAQEIKRRLHCYRKRLRVKRNRG